MAKCKSTPNLPASSRMQMASGAKDSKLTKVNGKSISKGAKKM